MRNWLTLILYFALTSNLFAQSYQWAKGIGSTNYDYGNSIATDASGNVYITGYFSSTADFDPGAGTANLTSAGIDDIFFAKYDNNGNYLWAKRIGSTDNDRGYSIATDAGGNVYITGDFRGTADFDPGAGTVNLTSAGYLDIFFAKYDNNGNYLWAKRIGSTDYDTGYSIATDVGGNVYITGNFSGTADFDPGAGIANITSAGLGDIFFAKYNTNGNYIWAKSIGGTSSDFGIGRSIATDAGGNVYITGYFSGTADFDPGAGTANLTSAGYLDIFFAKYDNNGNYLWAKSIGSTDYDDHGNSIATDTGGNVYITGDFCGTADFDPGSGTASLSSNGVIAIFFAKYNTNGNYLWAKSIGSTSFGRSIATDAGGNVYITGFFGDTVDFDPGAGTANLTSAGCYDIFFAKYNSLTGIVEHNGYNIEALSIYPNPFKESTTINFYNPDKIHYLMTLTDSKGRVVKKTENVTGNEIIIESKDLKAGVYFVELKGEDRTFRGKLMIE